MTPVVAGVKVAREILGANRLTLIADGNGGRVRDAKDDAAIAEHVRQTSETLYHPVGTCRMGQDAGSVVDDRLWVHGIAGLRIVDASVIPIQTTGHTNAPVMMMAEKAADLIKAEC